MELNQERLEKLVVEAAIEQLFDGDLHSLVSSKVNEEVKKRVDALFAERVNQRILDSIDEAVKEGFNRQYHLVDGWGKKLGETTLAAELEKKVTTYWTQTVDSRGEASNGYGAKQTRAEFLLGQIMTQNFGDYCKQVIANAAGPFKDNMRMALHKAINENLNEMLKFNSIGDQEIKKTGNQSPINP